MSHLTNSDRTLNNIKLFTGCTQEMIDNAKTVSYTEKEKISEILETSMQNTPTTISEKDIISKVQEVLDRKPEWDSRIKHLIIPFFLRSQKIYDWNADEFQERLNQIDLKIDKIEFEELRDITNLGGTAIDKIQLNSRVFFDKNGNPEYPVMETLFHELAHNTDVNKREGITTKEALQDAALGFGRFYEWTNTVFERLASGKDFYKKSDAMEINESGYGALAPLGSMLSCALGISEIEFAKIKDRGKDYEDQYLEKLFPGEASSVLERAKKIFDKYELDTYLSISKKSHNQNLLNEMYSECIEIMKKRIENDLNRGDIESSEEYKKHQMFFLKKMNVNFRSATKTDGLIFLKSKTIHDIGFCTDNLAKSDLRDITKEFISMANFGFDNSNLNPYIQSMALATKNNSFEKRLLVPFTRIIAPEKSKHNNTKNRINDEQEKS